jgi:hypothetical protein
MVVKAFSFACNTGRIGIVTRMPVFSESISITPLRACCLPRHARGEGRCTKDVQHDALPRADRAPSLERFDFLFLTILGSRRSSAWSHVTFRTADTSRTMLLQGSQKAQILGCFSRAALLHEDNDGGDYLRQQNTIMVSDKRPSPPPAPNPLELKTSDYSISKILSRAPLLLMLQ